MIEHSISNIFETNKRRVFKYIFTCLYTLNTAVCTHKKKKKCKINISTKSSTIDDMIGQYVVIKHFRTLKVASVYYSTGIKAYTSPI